MELRAADRRCDALFRAVTQACGHVLAPGGYAVVERGHRGCTYWVEFAPAEATLTDGPPQAPRLRLGHDPERRWIVASVRAAGADTLMYRHGYPPTAVADMSHEAARIVARLWTWLGSSALGPIVGADRPCTPVGA